MALLFTGLLLGLIFFYPMGYSHGVASGHDDAERWERRRKEWERR